MIPMAFWTLFLTMRMITGMRGHLPPLQVLCLAQLYTPPGDTLNHKSLVYTLCLESTAGDQSYLHVSAAVPVVRSALIAPGFARRHAPHHMVGKKVCTLTQAARKRKKQHHRTEGDRTCS